MIETLVETYGYAAIFIGTLLEGETILLVGGFAAHQGYLRLDLVILLAFVGSFCGDQIAYFVGRRFGRRLLATRPATERKVRKVTRLLERHSIVVLLGFRFIYGFRNICPIAISLSDIPIRKFIFLNLAGAALWAICFGYTGFAFGRAFEAAFGTVKLVEQWVIGIALAAAVLFALFHVTKGWILRNQQRGSARPFVEN